MNNAVHICRMSGYCILGTSESPGVIHTRLRTREYNGVSCDHQGRHSCAGTGCECSWLKDNSYIQDGRELCANIIQEELA